MEYIMVKLVIWDKNVKMKIIDQLSNTMKTIKNLKKKQNELFFKERGRKESNSSHTIFLQY